MSVPDVALQNGGGIRNNTVIAAGDITLLDTSDMVPFANFVSVVEDIPRDQFKEILENADALFDVKRGPKPVDESSPEDKLYSEIGKLKMQVDWLKKKLGE